MQGKKTKTNATELLLIQTINPADKLCLCKDFLGHQYQGNQ